MGIVQDFRFAVRLLLKDRWVTMAAVTALALGIGVNTAVFTLVNAVLLRGLPFEDADRIVLIGTRDSQARSMRVSLEDFEDWAAAAPRSFTDLSLIGSQAPSFNIADNDHVPEQWPGAAVSSNFFKLLRQQPILGRDFHSDDDVPGSPPVVMISHTLWQNRYGGSPEVIGREMKANGLPATIVGVMPEGMRFPPNSDFWVLNSQVSESYRSGLLGRDRRFLPAIGRLAEGTTIEQAEAELAGIATALGERYPVTNKGIVPTVEPYNNGLTSFFRTMFLSLMGAVAFVLLIACGNAANLLLARAAHRSREVSIRVALGATRWRIVRQLLIESLLLALVGGVLGLGLAMMGVRALDALVDPIGRPFYMDFTLDAPVILFLGGVCMTSALFFGLAPALHTSKSNANENLKEGGRNGSSGMKARRWTSALIVGQLALTLVLLSGAGFMIRQFMNQYRVDPGFESSHIVTGMVRMPSHVYPTPADRAPFVRRLDERLGNIPEFEAASIASAPPMFGAPQARVSVEGSGASPDAQGPLVPVVEIGERYFETLGIRETSGRLFARSDGGPGQHNAIVNQRFASMHFAGTDAVGRRIRLGMGPLAASVTIAGVVPNVRQTPIADSSTETGPVVYLPTGVIPTGFQTRFVIRTNSDLANVTRVLQDEVRLLDPDIPVLEMRTFNEAIAQQRWISRMLASTFTVFAFIALALAMVGLYAVTSYSVTQRTQEIGIRMALGARAPHVWRLVVQRTAWQLTIGIALGIGGVLAVGRLLQRIVVGGQPLDAWTIGAVVVLLMMIAVAACLFPARRATRLSPMLALRSE